MELEVIIQNGQEAVQAEKMGVNRLELVSAMQEGGLTPSYGTIKQVIHSVTIPVYVMIRPHRYHYYYQAADQEIIMEDIKKVIELGGTRIVFGALEKDSSIDERLIQDIIEIYPNLIITFHRAFDEVNCQVEAYKTLVKYKKNIKYILTSGAAESCLEGRKQLKKLVKLSEEMNGPKIMPGAGLNIDNIAEVHEFVKARHYHFGKAVRANKSFSNNYDPAIITKTREILNNG